MSPFVIAGGIILIMICITALIWLFSTEAGDKVLGVGAAIIAIYCIVRFFDFILRGGS
jgi:hypothetical protein